MFHVITRLRGGAIFVWPYHYHAIPRHLKKKKRKKKRNYCMAEGEIRRYDKGIVGMVENESHVCSTSSHAYAAEQCSVQLSIHVSFFFPLCFS